MLLLANAVLTLMANTAAYVILRVNGLWPPSITTFAIVLSVVVLIACVCLNSAKNTMEQSRGVRYQLLLLVFGQIVLFVNQVCVLMALTPQ